MLKKRIVPKLQMKRRMFGTKEALVLVTSINFNKYVDIGDPVTQAKICQDQVADELIFVDIDATLDSRTTLLLDTIHAVSEEVFMPFAVGGGVNNIEQFRLLLLNGADKVSVNTAAVENNELISQAANIFGTQCVILSIDYRKVSNEHYHVYTRCGTKRTDLDPVDWAKEGEKRGAGEILLTSIDRDGTHSGLDLELTKRITDAVSIPVITSGGCGFAKHFIDGFIQGKADAVSAGTYFSFRDENLMQVRSQVKNAGIPIRLHF